MSMKLYVMSCCFNEEEILPFYLDYYTNFIKADKIIIYDGGSTDNTPNIVKNYPNVEFIVDSKEKMDERNLRDIRNNGWKKYRDEYDWVIVCDMDEFIYHPNLKELLSRYDSENITIAKVNGYDMVSKDFPTFEKGKFLPSFITKGIHEPIWLNKSAVFNPKKVDINYDYGTHSCLPTGEIKYSETSDIKLLQYKWLSHEYITDKSLKSSQRLSDWNLETGMASHYKEYAKMNQDTFMNKLNTSTEIITDFPKKKDIYLFSHNYLINNWKEILENQLKLIKSSGLYDQMTNMYLMAFGESQWKDLMKIIRSYDIDDKIITLSIDENFYEYPTLQKLYKFVKNIENSHILYFHLKGVWSSLDTTRNNEAIVSWRKCLEYFNIEKWKDCVEKLDEGNEVVGALYNYNEKEPLFSGNFWWTTSDYIKKLKYPEYDSSKNPYLGTPEDDGTWCRVECEKWINTIPNKFHNFYIPKDYGFYYVPIDEKDYRETKIPHIYQNIDGWFDFETIYSEQVKINNDNSHFVEVGAWLGKSSSYMAVEIANSNKKIKFDVIDTWESTEIYSIESDPFNVFTKNIESVKNYLNPIQGTSKEISKNYLNNSLDFVFIDANHNYESVKEDIECWFPKVKNGGFIGGHDYFENYPGVMKAVNEFFGEDNIQFFAGSSWLIQKSNIKVSVIIPTYNRNLDKCVESVLNQKYDNMEILICHDGEWKEKCNYEDDRIKYLNTYEWKNDLGASQRNFCLDLITGDYVLFLDDDNILYENYLNKMTSNIKENTGMVVCKIHFNDKKWTNLILPREDKLIPCEIDHLSILFKSDVAKRFKWDNNWGQDHRYINSCEKFVNENGLEIKYISDVLANHQYLGQQDKKPIVIFNHNYLINNWMEIVFEQLFILKNSGLYDNCKNIYSYVTVQYEHITTDQDKFEEIIKEFDTQNKFKIIWNKNNNFEFDCLQGIYNFCESTPAYICYYHTKGVFSEKIKENKGIRNWRKYLNHFIITKWEDNINRLDEYDVCSVNYDYNDLHNDYVIGGNFFWSTSEYIKTLPYPETNTNRFEAENWILKNKHKSVFEHFNTSTLGIKNLYMEYLPPLRYRSDNDEIIDEIWWKANNYYTIQQKEYEWKNLIKFILESDIKKQKALEIGCYSLGGSQGLCELFDTVVSVDIEKRDNWDKFDEDHSNWSYFIGDSHSESMYNNIKNLNTKFDLIFIDGDHTHGGVKKDFEMYKEFLNDTGIVVFHDILDTKFHRDLNCFVHDFWKEVKDVYKSVEIINDREEIDTRHFMREIPNKDWGGIGILININKNRTEELLKEYRLPHLIDDFDGVNRLFGLKDLITENLDNNSVVCEIGSFVGKSSEMFAIYCKEVYCVDPWIPYHQIDDHMLSAESEFDKMSINYPNIKKIKMFSTDASKTFNNKKFDGIYIDAIHDYDNVKEDIFTWIDKVKDGGFISGHDYHMINDVKRAVDEIFVGCNIKVYSDYSWLVKIDEYRKKEVVIMTAHPNFKTSEDITKSAIQSFGDRDIILSTHCPVSVELQKMVKYFLYDKNNPLIRHDYYDQSWFNTDEYYALIKLHKNDNDLQHALAVYINYYNAVMYAKSLGYTTTICTNFDIVFSTEDLNTIDSKIKEMYQTGKKSFFMTSDANEGIHYKTIFFITDVDFFLDNFKYVTNEIDYNKLTREVGSETNCLENFFYQTLKNSDKLLLQQISENDLFSSSRVNVFSNIEYFTILPLRDNDNHFVVWFSSANSIDNRHIGINVLKGNETIFSHTEDLTQNYCFYKEIEFEKGCNYEIICSVHYTDVVNQKIIVVNDEIFSKIKEYGDFWKK